MIIYPYLNPIILTEAIYTKWGGQSGSATHDQLQGAFWIAEKRVTDYVGTFLLPTIVTGTYPYTTTHFIATDYGYVHQILAANVLSMNNLQTCTISSDSGCAFVFDDTFGYLNFSCVTSICGCSNWKVPYQFQIAYQAGLPTGTANLPGFEHALVIIAEESLQEMVYPRSGETVGNRGVQNWSAQGYSEQRKKWATTILGDSARARYAAELLEATVKRARRAVVFR